MQAQGKVIAILEARSGTSKAGREWMSQDYVIETPGQYPKRICFSLFGQDRINEAHIQMDEVITVDFDIDSHEWNGRWYTSINAYRITRTANNAEQGEPFPPMEEPPFAQNNMPQASPFDNEGNSNPADDLPF